MARVDYPITHLIHIDPTKARKQILDALREQKMHMANVAKAFGCTHGTLLTWVKKLDLREAIDDLRETAKAKGWHHDHVGGRPPGPAKTAKPAKAPRKPAKAPRKPAKPAKPEKATSKPKRRAKAT